MKLPPIAKPLLPKPEKSAGSMFRKLESGETINAKFDTDGNGILDEEEKEKARLYYEKNLHSIGRQDTNGDGVIDANEKGDMLALARARAKVRAQKRCSQEDSEQVRQDIRRKFLG